MNDETRKALDKIFNSKFSNAKPLGASGLSLVTGQFTGMFQLPGSALNHLRKLYDDAIVADDAAKLDAQRETDAKAAKDKQDKQNKGDTG